MKLNLQKFIPGENTSLLIIATVIGLMAGILNIVFRTTVEGVHWLVFEGGHQLLGINEVAGACSSCR